MALVATRLCCGCQIIAPPPRLLVWQHRSDSSIPKGTEIAIAVGIHFWKVLYKGGMIG
jgi:hypothetical protein